MANIAVMLKQLGKSVNGIDIAEEFITDASLQDNSIPFTTNFSDLACLNGYEVFVYSAAHGGQDNPLAEAARKKGMVLVSQPQLVGEIFARFSQSIAVSGCHGKTTTSSLLAWSLTKLSENPSYLIGAPPFEGGGGGKMTDSDFFVVEADEYGVHPPNDKTPKLLFLHPTYSLCMNIDFDHPDVYTSLEETKKTFVQFFSQSKNLMLCADDPVIRSLLPQLSNAKTYGTTVDCTYQIINSTANENGTSFELKKEGISQGKFSSLLFGEKNILNCAGVVALLIELGNNADDIRHAVSEFSGAKRRMETVWTDKTSYIIDDYGHHPAEIRATISALRSRFSEKKLHILFQPHTFSRTEELKDAFVTELSEADNVYLLPIFASARENASQFHITSDKLVQIAKHAGKDSFTSFNNKAELLAHLQEKWQAGDIVITLGAGDIYKLKDDIIRLIEFAKSK